MIYVGKKVVKKGPLKRKESQTNIQDIAYYTSAKLITRQPVIAVAVASEWVGSTQRSSEEASKRSGAGKRAKSRRKSGCWAMPRKVACKPSDPEDVVPSSSLSSLSCCCCCWSSNCFLTSPFPLLLALRRERNARKLPAALATEGLRGLRSPPPSSLLVLSSVKPGGGSSTRRRLDAQNWRSTAPRARRPKSSGFGDFENLLAGVEEEARPSPVKPGSSCSVNRRWARCRSSWACEVRVCKYSKKKRKMRTKRVAQSKKKRLRTHFESTRHFIIQ